MKDFPPKPTSAPIEKDPVRMRLDLARYRAETERLRVLVEFLSHPIHAHGGTDPDPDIVVAYNLAVEAALQGIRRAAAGGVRAGEFRRPADGRRAAE